MKVNFHTHSIYSDGSYTVEELVNRLAKNNVEMASLTDHDTIMAVNEFNKLCDKKGIKTINGIEISCNFPSHLKETIPSAHVLHILGYGYSINKMQDYFDSFYVEHRERIVNEIIEDLKVKYPEFKVTKIRKYPFLCISDLVYSLVASGIYDNEKVSRSYIRETYRHRYYNGNITTKEAIDVIHKCGGKAILAHPSRRGFTGDGFFTNEELDVIVAQLHSEGLDGLEVYYEKFPQELIQENKTIADKYNMLYSFGADTHDDFDSAFVDVDEVKSEKLLLNSPIKW